MMIYLLLYVASQHSYLTVIICTTRAVRAVLCRHTRGSARLIGVNLTGAHHLQTAVAGNVVYIADLDQITAAAAAAAMFAGAATAATALRRLLTGETPNFNARITNRVVVRRLVWLGIAILNRRILYRKK